MPKISRTPAAQGARLTAWRNAELVSLRNLKMARSAHRYVRGSTAQFYEWLHYSSRGALPEGPPIWICGDCHVGNLGPIANSAGHVEVQIRDLDQTVIGNPAHDLVRLGLSLASAARSSDLPGVTTSLVLEQMMLGYAKAFAPDFNNESDLDMPAPVASAIRESNRATWKTLAMERIAGTSPSIPLGRRFWAISKAERKAVLDLVGSASVQGLVTQLKSRDDGAVVELADAAYWVKGCSSLGRLRYALVISIRKKRKSRAEYCLVDVKEAVKADAPHASGARMPTQQGQRVVEGARHLSPHLGKRMCAATFLNRAVFVRELLPQDLKFDIERLSPESAMQMAYYLAAVVGKAHSRQLDMAARKSWLEDLAGRRSKLIDAPTWLWSSVVDLMGIHERAYLEHCRRYALARERADAAKLKSRRSAGR